MAGEKRATPRVREHVNRLRDAGADTAKFFDALCALRDDSALPKAHRDAIYKLIAMESFIWYLEALRNEPIDRDKLLEQAKEIASQPAIVKKSAGDQAAALAKADVGKKPDAAAKPAAVAKPTAAAAPGPASGTVSAAKPTATPKPAAPGAGSPAASPRPAVAAKPAAPATGAAGPTATSAAKPTPKK